MEKVKAIINLIPNHGKRLVTCQIIMLNQNYKGL